MVKVVKEVAEVKVAEVQMAEEITKEVAEKVAEEVTEKLTEEMADVEMIPAKQYK